MFVNHITDQAECNEAIDAIQQLLCKAKEEIITSTYSQAGEILMAMKKSCDTWHQVVTAYGALKPE